LDAYYKLDDMSPVVIIRASEHLEAMTRVLSKYGLPATVLEVVSSVYDWCKDNGVAETNPHRMAKCFFNWDNDNCHIVMRDCFSQADFDSAKAKMEIDGFSEETRQLVSPELSLLHLFLHEIAGPILKTTEQRPRDAWAFKELGNHVI
jgi:hypothetical protein